MIEPQLAAVACPPKPRTHRTAVLIGLALGVFSVLADGVVRWRAFTTLGNIISPWVIAAFVAGRMARVPRAGSWAGFEALVVGVVGYYVLQGIRFASDASSPALVDATHLVWLLAAFVVGPLMGAAGAASTRPRPPLLAVVAPGVALIAEAAHLLADRQPWRWNLARELYRLTDVLIFAALVGLALLLPALLTEDRRQRRLAHALLVIGGAAGALGIRLLYRTITTVA